jgi:cytochrome c peroxidase
MRKMPVLLVLLVAGSAFAKAPPPKKKVADKPKDNPSLGLQDMPVPPDNPQTPEKIALGRQLFWDARLSKSGKMSCESCHLPEKGWADGQKLSTKDDGKVNTRHTPSLLNAAFAPYFYWDGRAPTLEKQVAAAWRGQMAVADDAGAGEVAKKLAAVEGYKKQFQAVFKADPTPDNIVQALASYVRTLTSGNSAYDRAEAGDAKAYTPAQKRGRDLFMGKAKCSLCHAGFAFSAWEFKNIGIGMDKPTPDPGRGKVDAKDPKLVGAFRVPTLRNIAKHAPYMHDGRFDTLAQVVDYFEKPIDNPTLDEKIKGGIQLTAEEKKDLIAFLEALNGSEPDPTPPKLP